MKSKYIKTIFIPGNIPSSKNSKVWTGKFLVNSSTVTKYLKSHKSEWETNLKEFQDMIKDVPKPYKIGFYFIRDSKRKFDYINACQLPCDLMTKYKWVEDDNCDEIIPVFLGYEVDKPNAGVRITVID